MTQTYFTGYQAYFNSAGAATIAASSTTSGALACSGFTFCGVQIPAAFTGTTVTFLVSSDGTTFQPLYNAAGQVSYTVAAGHYIAIDPKDFYGAAYVKIVSNATEASNRALVCSLRGF